MSDIKDETLKHLEEVAAVEKLKQDNTAKKAILDNKRLNFQLEQVTQHEKDLVIAKNTNYGALTDEQIARLQKANDEYIEAAKNGMSFICDTFKGIAPYFQKNLFLIGGKTGEGKSTTVANIAWSTICQRSPITGKGRRVLVLTNEENAEDFYNRVTCLAHGWHYTNHDKFTDEQTKTFREWMPKLAKGGRLTVVDNVFNGSNGVTTSIEGIQGVFENLIANGEYYDVILIDYYQNIKYSKKSAHLTEFEVQAIFANMMDRYKNEYPAPIVVMSQINPQDDKNTPFQYRIKGRKVIMDPCTFVLEMKADRENLQTEWTVHKSRFTEAVGSCFYTGYDKGRFVVRDAEFLKKLADYKDKKMFKALDKANGIKDAFKGEDDGNKTESD